MMSKEMPRGHRALLLLEAAGESGVTNEALAEALGCDRKVAATAAWWLRIKKLVHSVGGTHHITPAGSLAAKGLAAGEPMPRAARRDFGEQRVSRPKRSVRSAAELLELATWREWQHPSLYGVAPDSEARALAAKLRAMADVAEQRESWTKQDKD